MDRTRNNVIHSYKSVDRCKTLNSKKPNTRVSVHAGTHKVHGSMYLATVKVGKVISFTKRPC